MKKRMIMISFFFVGCFLFMKYPQAKAFQENQLASKFDLYIYSSKMHLRKNFRKITDENGIPLYDVSPTITSFSNLKDYKMELSQLDREQIEILSKIMYFGYGYNNHKSDSYYFATQYLIYKTFPILNTTYDLIDLAEDYMTKEIQEIEKSVEKVSFSLQDFTTKSSSYIIDDAYILDNFTIEGDDVNVFYENNKIKLLFIGERETYSLRFYPKNSCQDTYVWTSTNINLLSRGTVCEKEYEVVVRIEKETENENGDVEEIEKPEEEIPDKEDKVEETLNKEPIFQNFEGQNTVKVTVPNTKKNSFYFLEFIFLLGNFYFVFKK